MYSNYLTSVQKTPEMFVTKDKHRLKQHGNTVYLKNGEEFQIELFNPLTIKILAKIELNGISIGSGLIIRPGERVFLERYLETAKKFLFETYQINGNNKEALGAIKNNGKVHVKFYKQYQSNVISNSSNITWTNYNYDYTGIKPWDGTITCYNSSFDTPIQTSISTTSFNSSPRKMETGRIEQGSDSKQSFQYDSTTFEFSPFYTTSWEILPQSQKEITREDLVVYCVKCGRRKRDNENYCPKDGNKF